MAVKLHLFIGSKVLWDIYDSCFIMQGQLYFIEILVYQNAIVKMNCAIPISVANKVVTLFNLYVNTYFGMRYTSTREKKQITNIRQVVCNSGPNTLANSDTINTDVL